MAARNAFDNPQWSENNEKNMQNRSEMMIEIAHKIDSQREYIAMLLSWDTGKTLDESFANIDDCIQILQHFARKLKINQGTNSSNNMIKADNAR